jgi:hypothetical protein
MPCYAIAPISQAFLLPRPALLCLGTATLFLCISWIGYAMPSQKPNAFFAFSFLYFSFYIINNYMSYII